MATYNNRESTKEEDVNIIRTYTSDIADVIKNNDASVVKIALAEKKKKEEEFAEKTEAPKNKKFFWLITGITLIVFAVFISFYSIEKKKERNTPVVQTKNIKSFILYEKNTNIHVSEYFDQSKIFDLIKNEAENQDITNGVKIFSIVKKINELEYDVDTDEFFSLIKSSTPFSLIKFLDKNFNIGSYYSQKIINDTTSQEEKYNLFFIFKINDYNQVYASILEWEKTMLSDLYNLFKLEINNDLIGKKWEDVIINNRDVRVINDFDKKGILYYTFVNKQYLIISNRAEVLNEISFRLIYGKN